VEPVVVFVYSSRQCARLIRDLHELLQASGERPRMKVVRAKVADPEELPAFLSYMEEVYGAEYTEEYKRYGVRRLPALVVRGVKIVEGRFPSRDELAEMLAKAGFSLPPQPAGAPGAVEARRGCEGCVFYDAGRGRCTILHVRVQQPSSPPCEQG